ncbi:sigma-70 family RNA polymerase sigma factor [Nocardia blacklockiae]|uniref:sigma-70 family RNA polymerase sigma factor n=1 Tax=Nocardia blacklockiae TaxID=480036 RepID=UPI0018935843|nr:sigma-70 family RNA polymerase sigma factor [Nocardia blacklockiae]MBF6172898.1 sigma-70 family RNA polymerase sigma factor [Nocardia blacklockiae]
MRPSEDQSNAATETFLAHRDLLFTVAREMLGTAADAEDVLRKSWLRWHRVEPGQVGDPRAYLVRIVTRQCLDRLRESQRRNDSGPAPLPDAVHEVELAESMSMALMLVLDTLAPTERAVFVLRETFDLGYDEIADAVGKTTAAVRQIAHRARRHVAVRRPRRAVSASRARAATASVRRALETGNPQILRDVLAPDVVLVGAGRVAARPITGVDEVIRFFADGLGTGAAALTCEPVTAEGNAALAVHADGEFDGILAIGLAGDRITGLYFVRTAAADDRGRTIR